MLNIILAVTPIVLYLVILYAMDKFMLARWRMLTGMLIWGILAMLAAYGLSQLNSGKVWDHAWATPLVEEVLKSLPLIILIFRKKIAFYAETLIYGQVAGAGFALGENILYTSTIHNMTATTAIVRGFGTALMHMGCTALIASLVLVPVLYASQHKCSGKVKFGFCITFVLIFIPSVVIHYLHNMDLQFTNPAAPFIQLIAIVVCFFILFTLIEAINELLIIKWMDVSITDDVKLLQAIKDGNLMTTNAGKYLVAIRDKFDKLVFFDMCVYVSLYLELLIAAKSRMMLHESGLDKPETDEQQAVLKSRKDELHAIKKRIPRLGLRLLAPLIHASNQNEWAIDHL